MANTAIRAEKKDTRTIIFKNREHENFYKAYLPQCRYQDTYHKALVYCLGIDRDTRGHVKQIYDFQTGCVKPECLQEGWQTSSSVKIIRMALISTAMEHPVFIILKILIWKGNYRSAVFIQ